LTACVAGWPCWLAGSCGALDTRPTALHPFQSNTV
jgi:hypothetical protein